MTNPINQRAFAAYSNDLGCESLGGFKTSFVGEFESLAAFIESKDGINPKDFYSLRGDECVYVFNLNF